MKKIIFAIVAGLISALAAPNESRAQTQDVIASAGSGKNYYKMPNTGVADNTNTANANMVNAKALKNFRKLYSVSNEKWFLQADCIIASYELDNISHTIYFDKKGHWIGSLKSYTEDKMQGDIRKMVREKYYDYKILLVQEIEYQTVAQPTYIVTIQDDKNVKQIRIQNDGEMDVYKEFARS